jgi:hypothetical protein
VDPAALKKRIDRMNLWRLSRSHSVTHFHVAVDR